MIRATVMLAPALLAFALSAQASEVVDTQSHEPKSKITSEQSEITDFSARKKRRGGGGGGISPACHQYRATIESIVGAAHVNCYMRLFHKESSCRPHYAQAKGHVGNPAAGYGLCTLERSPHLRRRRGAACNDISTIEGQIRCCQSIMRRTPSYFGPVNRKEISRCG